MLESGVTRLTGVQILRGVAALLVVTLHLTQAAQHYLGFTYLHGLLLQGGAGVDIFFVLSGFIIFYVHHSHVGDISRLWQFVKKRFIRIYPLYWLVLLPVTAVYFFMPSFGQGSETNIPVIIRSFLLLPIPDTVLGVAWSLSYELVFYVVFAMFIWKPRFTGPITVVWLIVVMATVFGLMPVESFLGKFFTSQLLLEFALGCLAAFAALRYDAKYGRPAVYAGEALLVICWLMQQWGGTNTLNRIVAYAVPTALLLFGLTGVQFSFGPLVRFGCFVGDASYSIYLSHQVLLSALFKVTRFIHLNDPLGPFVTTTLLFIFAVGLGCTLHVVVERPLLETLKRRLLPVGGGLGGRRGGQFSAIGRG